MVDFFCFSDIDKKIWIQYNFAFSKFLHKKKINFLFSSLPGKFPRISWTSFLDYWNFHGNRAKLLGWCAPELSIWIYNLYCQVVTYTIMLYSFLLADYARNGQNCLQKKIKIDEDTPWCLSKWPSKFPEIWIFFFRAICWNSKNLTSWFFIFNFSLAQ